jgi:LysM repeat protein
MRIARLIATLSLLAVAAPAQDAAALANEIVELRKTVELQSKQIEALTQQVSKLTEGKSAAEPASATTQAPAAAPGKEEFSTENAPKAEPAQPRHVVVKGETLTSIAKHYNVPLAEVMKANKGLDERKLQIGQSIILPATPAPAKPSDTKPTQ